MDSEFDLDPRYLAERLRNDGITGKTLTGSEVFKKESLLNAAARRITTFATGKEARPQHYCRVYYEDRQSPEHTNRMPQQDNDIFVNDNDPSQQPPANSSVHTRVPSKTKKSDKKIDQDAQSAAKNSRSRTDDKGLEQMPHRRSGIRTRSQGESENLSLTEQLMRELRQKKKKKPEQTSTKNPRK
jgi:hypothetical protein